MAAKQHTIITTVYEEKRTSVDDPSIAPGDWRDPDKALECQEYTCYSNDLAFQESHSVSAPDWSLGGEIRDSKNQVVDKFGGEPIQVIKDAILEGRLLVGCLVARDFQRHG